MGMDKHKETLQKDMNFKNIANNVTEDVANAKSGEGMKGESVDNGLASTIESPAPDTLSMHQTARDGIHFLHN